MGEESERRVVPAREILAKIERGEPVEYDGVIIEDDLDISGLDLPTVHVERTEAEKQLGLTEERKVISSQITNTNSEIQGKVNFRNAQFQKPIDFRGSKFTGGGANFWEAEFGRNASFGGAVFGGDANFVGTRFTGGDAHFWEAEFGRNAHFWDAEFGGHANFEGAEFGGGAYFGKTKFAGGYAYFGKTKFIGGIAYFERAEFGGDAYFGKTKFAGGHAHFVGAKFAGEHAHFVGAEFAKDAYFVEAEFGGDAYFWEAEFGGDAHFVGTKFTGGDTHFGGAVFGGNAHFVRAEFKGDAYFVEAKFGGNAYFWGAEFEGNASFWGAEFEGNASFDHDQFSKDLSFEDTKFAKPKSQEIVCRIAKRKMEEQGNKTTADHYFFREIEAIRIQNGIRGIERKTYPTPANIRERLSQLSDKTKLLPSKIKRFLIYDVLEYVFIQRVFGYGVRPFNVAKAWLTVVFVLGFVYWAGAGLVRGNEPLEWYEYFYFSIVTAATPGYAGYTPATGFYIFLAGAQAIFGTFMWAAFIATFARKWQR
ncbi:pentapeptide repeat-containing protein [Candidatus Methanocrinis natronophilus]|uniref:Pentapeptide repeat-containing protein n=1 Tax=Candidatus Methanocrinis natronophilus TaxID=3033396 RepID=A0ABT5XAJ9_9EURY|nr:pentapeptide repeat-containing protein [Candidatus Methanocrinis natronophilus]MDF0591735.1 pentapeptide repeat-containing protein [Candidatus Methanocrinis natronophilus]